MMKLKICIDPGHGGRDPGAVGPSGLKEKDVTLTISLKLRDKLQSRGIQVIMTRETDKALGSTVNENLNVRSNIANNAKVDYFVSIHCNSANATARGTETYCFKFGGNGEKLARSIQDKLIHAVGLYNRGVKEANFAVLRNTYMPAVLVELAFISNPAEEKLLADEMWQDIFANAIAEGIFDFLGNEHNKPKEVRKVINNVPDALNVLVEKGLINSPDYWLKAVDVVKYLDVLLINMANKIS